MLPSALPSEPSFQPPACVLRLGEFIALTCLPGTNWQGCYAASELWETLLSRSSQPWNYRCFANLDFPWLLGPYVCQANTLLTQRSPLHLVACGCRSKTHATMPVLCKAGDRIQEFTASPLPGPPPDPHCAYSLDSTLTVQQSPGRVCQERCLGSLRSPSLSVSGAQLWGVADSATLLAHSRAVGNNVVI